MEGLDTNLYLNELWALHSSRGDRMSLFQYLEEFVAVYNEMIQPKFYEKLNITSHTASCYKLKENNLVELEHFPEQLLQLILTQLMRLQDQCSDFKLPDVRLATYLVQTLIIISRTGNTELISLSSNLIGHVVLIASQVVAMLRSEDKTNRDIVNLEKFLSQVFFFTECLYDPLFNWRKTLSRKKVLKKEEVKVPLLNTEVIPFFYETLQIHSHLLSINLQQQLLNMFGSILFGFHGNALLATSATTLEILLKYLTEYSGVTNNTNNGTLNAHNGQNNGTDNDINNGFDHDVDNGLDNDYENVNLILRLIVKMVHTLHNSNPGQCQLDVSTVMKEYFKLLSKTNSNPEVQLKIIGFIPDFLDTKDRPALQMLLLNHGCLDYLRNVLTNFAAKSEERSEENEKFASHFINIVNCLVAGSMTAKDQFSKCLGTTFILDNLRVICVPTKQVLFALLSMAVESDNPLSFPIPIKNVFIILMLFDWLPEIKQEEQQVWLSSVLTNLFTTCTSNKILACHCKTVTKVLTCLIKYPDLHKETVLNLLNLIQRLGSYTLSSRQTAGFLELLRQDSASHPHMNKYFDYIMKSLSMMAAHQVTDRKPAYFFDLQDQTSGITAPVLKKWGGPGFSIHAWLCLEFFMAEARVRKRRQFYSFMTDQGTGMEAFFTSDCMLVVAVITKKNYFTIKLNECPIHDNKWHCVQIVHHPARKVFGFNGSLQIFIDNELKLTTSLRFPSLSGSFTSCHIGSSAHRTNSSYLPPDKSANENNSSNSDRVVVIETGSQDEVWGQATSLLGQLGSVVVFNDVIKETHLSSMFNIGPDMWRSNRSAESPLEEISPSKVVLYYEAKGCFRHVCKDVSCNDPPREGRLTGHKIYTSDVKDSINCLGGITVLTPLIEVINSKYQLKMEAFKNNEGSLEELSGDLNSNLLADFFTLIMNFITSSNTGLGWHAVNANMMVNCGTVATLGALIKKMPASLLDEHLLRSIQCLVKAVNFTQCNNGALLMDLYQYLLFDFRIWCLTDANVQYSHVQYLSTIIKENKKFFRSTFGVQYLLDVIKTYYCSTDENISSEKIRNIRNSLLGLVKYYITDDITMAVVTSLFNFMLACKDLNDIFICEILDMLKSLWMCQCRDQLCSLMSSSYATDFLYAMLALSTTTDQIKVAVCQFLILLFKSRSVAEKHKSNLKLTNVGFHGIIFQLTDFNLSHQLSALILDLVMAVECDSATFIAVFCLLRRSDLSIRKLACQHFLELAYSKNNFLIECARQHGWQTHLTNLLALDVEGYSSNVHTPVGNTEFQVPVLNGNNVAKELDELDSTFDKLSFSSDSKSHISNGSDYIIVKHKDVKIEGDLVDLVVESIFLLTWRGVQGSNKEAWKERTLVFDSLRNVADNHTLLGDYDVIKTGILEHCLEASMSDVRETTTTSVKSSVIEATENSAELVRFIDQQLNGDDVSANMWSIKLLENLFGLYDALVVWDAGLGRGNEWGELSNIGFRMLLGCINTRKLELVAMASAKLHNLIHSRDPASTHEVCFLLDGLQSSVDQSIQENSNVKEFVVPLIRDLLDKNFTRLDMGPYLPGLPPLTGNPHFFDDFIDYFQTGEWLEFINSVKQNASHFKKEVFQSNSSPNSTDEINDFLVPFHLSQREKGDAQIRFKSHFESNFYEQRQVEEERQNKNSKSLYNQNVAVLRQWRAAKRFLASERGFWKERNPAKTYWKLSNVENFSRMRLKLTENHNFDNHEDASRLRDNLQPSEIEASKPSEDALQFAAVLTQNETSKEDDGVGDEDWNMLVTNLSTSEEQTTKEKVVFSDDCELVTLMDVVAGKLEVSTTHVYFYDKTTETEDGLESGLDFKWSLSQLREVHLRRYNLRKCAIEVFLIDQTNYFLNFYEPHTMHIAYKTLFSVRPPNLLYYGIRSPQELLKSSGLTSKWVQREVSNFDYLMQLNTIAGRTYNDLSQYPVFPWILNDYTSDKLDLNDPKVYRDLSKPIGILNPDNEQHVRDKHDQFEDPSGVVAKFHYGSHYSNAASVLFYMLRMEPFTTLHIQLQAGRFDLSDRQFHSLNATFQNMLDSTNDVKELIPEFFYMPEFLSNSNRFNLGKLQFSKETVNDVILPPWAKSSEDFIFQHRKALESDYVSSHLHEWIDLIFGYKQRGQAAVDACNVFYYCTYEGAVDLNSISDPIQRKAVEGMINNFGQTPTQLLSDPHPRRMGVEEASRKVMGGGRIMSTLNSDVRSPNVLEQPDQLKTFYVDIMVPNDPLIYVSVPRNQSHSFMQSGMPDAMVTVSERCVIGSHGWLPYDRSITNYFTFEKDPAVNHSRLQKKIKGLLSPGLRLTANLFLATHDAKFLFVGGFWDNSIRVMTLRGKMVANLVRHLDVVTCLALDHGGIYLLSGSYDTTCIIWKITNNGNESINGQPVHILYGHEDVVTCVVINSELDVALSSSKDGTCIIHTVRKGHYVRTIRPVGNHILEYTIPLVAMSGEGRIVVYARANKEHGIEKHFLHLFSINGKHLALDCLEARLGHMTVCGEHLVTGDHAGLLAVRELSSFDEISSLSLCRPITCVYVTKGMTHIMACLRDGKLIIVGVDRPAKPRGLFKT